MVLPQTTPGWHPIQGDPSKLRYWDGTQWTGHLEWDGQQWAQPGANVPA